MKTIEDVIFEELGRPFDSFKTGDLVVFTMKDIETIRTVLHDFDNINTELVSVTNERDHFKTEAEMYKNNDADECMRRFLCCSMIFGRRSMPKRIKKLRKSLEYVANFCEKQKWCSSCPLCNYSNVEQCIFMNCPVCLDISEMTKKKKRGKNDD